MANYTFDKFEYGGNTFIVEDSAALPLTGGTVTGPVTFNDAVSMADATSGNLVVTGNLAATNNIQANTINGVTVGSSPKFTDTVLSIGTTATTAAAGNHTHATTIAASTGTNQLTLAFGSKYSITAGGTSYIFTMPSLPVYDGTVV